MFTGRGVATAGRDSVDRRLNHEKTEALFAKATVTIPAHFAVLEAQVKIKLKGMERSTVTFYWCIS